MKTKKSLLVYSLLVLAIVLTSVATTLALVTDEHNATSGLIKFDKVALADHGHGSNLQVTLNADYVGNGEVVFNGSGENDFLWVRPADVSANMFVRFKAYFTLGDKVKDQTHKNTLALLNNDIGRPKGFELYTEDGIDYNLVPYGEWVYIATSDIVEPVEKNVLKVVQNNTDSNGKIYILSKFYRMTYDGTMENDIFDMIEANNNQITLKVEVEAIQCEGISNNIQDAIEQTQGNNDIILDSSNEQSLEDIYGNVTIAKYKEASDENYYHNFRSGLPTEKKSSLNDWTWKEIKAASNIIEKANAKYISDNAIADANLSPYNSYNYTNIVIDSVKVSSSFSGVRGSKEEAEKYSWTFTFDEGGIKNSISIGDTKDLVMTNFLSQDSTDPYDYYGYDIIKQINSETNAEVKTTVRMIVSDFLHDCTRDENNEILEYVGITFTSGNIFGSGANDSSSKYLEIGIIKQVNSTSNPHGRNDGGYYNLNYTNILKALLNGEFLGEMEEEDALGSDIIESVHKESYAYYNSNSNLCKMTYRKDTIWLLSVTEAHPSPSYTTGYGYKGEGRVYPIFTSDNATRVRNLEYISYGKPYTKALEWWTRSTYTKNNYSFCYIYAGGSIGIYAPASTLGVVFGFAV